MCDIFFKICILRFAYLVALVIHFVHNPNGTPWESARCAGATGAPAVASRCNVALLLLLSLFVLLLFCCPFEVRRPRTMWRRAVKFIALFLTCLRFTFGPLCGGRQLRTHVYALCASATLYPEIMKFRRGKKIVIIVFFQVAYIP